MRSLLAQLRVGKSRKQRWFGLLAAGVVMSGWLAAGPVAAQQTGQTKQTNPFPDQTPTAFGTPRDQDPDVRLREEKLARGRNVERQQKLVSETDRLLALAKELKEEVAKSNKDTLSIDVVKKASEIEKLAKSVRERMRE